MSLNDSVPPPAAQDARPSTPPPGGSAASPGTAEDIFARGRARLPLVKVVGVSHIVLERPLLDDMRHFLLDFGLRRSAQDRHGDYFRGSSGAHHLVAVRRAPTPRAWCSASTCAAAGSTRRRVRCRAATCRS